jgi:hypothetical protein
MSSIVYVKLLHEGVEVFRPVDAIQVAENVYVLCDEYGYNPMYEDWEFSPGTTVRVEERVLVDGVVAREHLVAIEALKQR